MYDLHVLTPPPPPPAPLPGILPRPRLRSAQLERLLRNENEKAHLAIADALWDTSSDADALAALERMAASNCLQWEEEFRSSAGTGRGRGGDDDRDSGEGRG